MCEKERKEVSSVAIAFFLCGLCGRQSIDWCMAERGDRRHVLFVTPDVALSPHQQPRRSVEFPLAPRPTFNTPRINYPTQARMSLGFRPRYAPDVDTSTIANHLPMGGATYSQPGARAPGSKILLVTISSRYVPVHQGIRAVVHQGQQMFPLFQFSRVGYLAF
jgi:hypothetical protein